MGYIHLTYHSTKTFTQEGIDFSPAEIKYTLLSKWIIFIVYTFIEETVLYLFEWIPFIYILSTFLKFKILSLDSDLHLTIYDKTFFHMSEFDLFHEILKLTAGVNIVIFEKGMKVMSSSYALLTLDQIDKVKRILADAIKRLE